MNSLCCKRLRIQAKSEPPNTPTRETSSASFSLGSKAIYCTHLRMRNTLEEQTLTRVVGAWVAVVKLPRTITVPLHVAPLRGWKLGACHAAGHMLLGSNMPSTCFIFPIPRCLFPCRPHCSDKPGTVSFCLLPASRNYAAKASTINLPSLER